MEEKYLGFLICRHKVGGPEISLEASFINLTFARYTLFIKEYVIGP